MLVKNLIFPFLMFLFYGCTSLTPLQQNIPYTHGPLPVSSIYTPYDDLIDCLKKVYVGKPVAVGVGKITDQTGKFSIGDSGNGKFVTQGAADMVQSALMQSGVVRVVNRTDPGVMQLEAKFGRKFKWLATDYHITGSINSLDFLPGGGMEANVWGIGAKYRQYRMLIGLDLALTHTKSSEIIAVSSIFKQIVADEMGAGVGRFFGTTLVAIDLGHQNREAVHFATRNMLKLAVYQLISKLYDVQSNGCNIIHDQIKGVTRSQTRIPSLSVEPF